MAKKVINVNVEKGDIVKIKRDGERFWIIVKYLYKDGQRMRGIADNNTIDGEYKIGDNVTFNRDEIVDIYGKK